MKEIVITLTPDRVFCVQDTQFSLDTMVKQFGTKIPRSGEPVVYTQQGKVRFEEEAAAAIRAEKGRRIEHYKLMHPDEEQISSHDLRSSFGRMVTTRR